MRLSTSKRGKQTDQNKPKLVTWAGDIVSNKDFLAMENIFKEEEKLASYDEEVRQESMNTQDITSFMYSYQVEGMVIDQTWYKIIRTNKTKKKPEGKPHYAAIHLLAEIVDWYQPTSVRDEEGNVTLHKKFKGDMLQRSYADIEKSIGLTKVEARSAFETLEKYGIAKREFRTVEKDGLKIPNVMFIQFNPLTLKRLTFEHFQ